MSAAIIILYAVMAALVGCRLATTMTWNAAKRTTERNKRLYSWTSRVERIEDNLDWFDGAAAGVLLAPIWPLVLVIYVARGRLFRPPLNVERELQAQRIADLERQLRIGEHA